MPLKSIRNVELTYFREEDYFTLWVFRMGPPPLEELSAHCYRLPIERAFHYWRKLVPQPETNPFAGMAEIHISDVRTFKACRRRWRYTSPLGMYLEPRVAYAPFILGRAVHYALQMYYDEMKTKDANKYLWDWFKEEVKKMGQLTEVESNMLAEQLELGLGLTEHYTLWTRRADDGTDKWHDNQFEFIATEVEFKVPLYKNGRASKDFYFAGRFDGIIRRKDNGKYYIWETKTARSIPELEGSLWNDEQCGGYMLAAERLMNLPISGVLYNIIRKKVPTTPAMLKNGTLSRAKSTDTSYDWYLNEILETDPKPEDVSEDEYQASIIAYYGEYLKHLREEKDDKWFKRVVVSREPEQLSLLEDHLYQVASEMVDPNTALYPSPSWNCNYCKFQEPCKRLNKGASDEFALKAEFKRRGEWQPLTGKETDDDHPD